MIHLEAHSRFSLMEGTPGVRQLVARAVEHGMRALALADTGGLYGAVPFYQAAREAGVSPILGARLGPCVVLARDRDGYGQLCFLVTVLQLGEKGRAEQTGRMGNVSSGGADNRGDALERVLSAWPFPFGDEHLFVLSDDTRLIGALLARGLKPLVALTHYGGAAARYRCEKLHAFAKRRGLRAAAVNPVYFLEPRDYRIHQTLCAVRHNTTVDTLEPGDAAPPGAWFRAPHEMERLYADWPDALLNTEWAAEQCELELSLGKPLFPELALPDGETPFSSLWKKTFEGAKARYRPLTPAIMDRLHYELGVIDRLGFAPYFLIVWDIVQYARGQGIPILGRGSAANSAVAYALGITRVDPFHYDLYFERFLNPDRTDCPDIDLDMCWRRRDEVVEYVYTRYGSDRVAMIASFNTFQARSALRETAKAHGLTDREIGEVTRRIPHYGAGDIRTLAAHIPECRGLRFDEEPLRSILEIAECIGEFPRHLSMHPCGLVIAPEPLTRFTPLQRAAKGFVVTQYDMGPVEALGLVKMDLLGHRSLTVIDDTLRLIKGNRGVELDLEHVPDRDPLTARLLIKGHTIGCFQIESPAMRGLLPKVRARDTEMVIKALSLIRPGPAGSGMKERFIARCRGLEAVDYLHPALEEVLRDTCGVMLYQEDILKVASAVAGMSLAEADALRRAMTKKRSPREMAKSMKRFIEKARANGVAGGTAQEIWERVASFAAYSYCKAHAATYGELAYRCTYLKAHYTPEFLAAVLTNRGGFYTPHVYLEEAKRFGIEVRPPCINRSAFEYTVEDDAIRIGFIEVRDLSHTAVEAVLEARRHGPFESVADLYERTGIAHADATALFDAGAFDCFAQARPAQFLQLHTTYSKAKQIKTNINNLFLASDNINPPHVPDYPAKKRTDLEWSALGLLAGPRHPLLYYQNRLQDHQLVLSIDLPHYAGQTVTAAGWLIAQRRVALKDGRGVMKFLTCEDTAGTFEAVLFPETYQQFGPLLTSLGPYLLTGEVQTEHDAPALLVQQVARIQAESLPKVRAAALQQYADEAPADE